jgi:hypothetical protein
VQLGELQHQIERFERRGVSVIALSVDEPQASLAMIERMGLSFPLGSDPEQRVIQAFRVQNPDTRELAIHAVYIVDRDGVIFYRKVGLRRPVSRELIDAIDAHRGEYPRTDEVVAPPERITVAWPRNNFQALLGVSAVAGLPDGIDPDGFAQVLKLQQARRSDDALVAFKALIADSPTADEGALLDTAAWLVRERFFADKPNAIETGQLLAWRLNRIGALEAALESAADPDVEDELLQNLAKARAGLTVTRTEIVNHADDWNLRYVKTSLRSYREVVRAELRMRAARI